ncbi:hypothetical protein BB8028_0005g05200 [Beauveria bassiana]|uniref:Uncharacterized protein n=1 Tax=Beauveria bassiana TaxID=176275 RepID=A0A2S7YGK7_BEABA|nr:hypothetical protein BB8028_0005g05200 [Beauveria bassiana]
MELTRLLLLQGTNSRPELDLERKKRGKGNSLQCVCPRTRRRHRDWVKERTTTQDYESKKNKRRRIPGRKAGETRQQGKAADKLTRDGRTELVRPCHVSVSVSVRLLRLL